MAFFEIAHPILDKPSRMHKFSRLGYQKVDLNGEKFIRESFQHKTQKLTVRWYETENKVSISYFNKNDIDTKIKLVMKNSSKINISPLIEEVYVNPNQTIEFIYFLKNK